MYENKLSNKIKRKEAKITIIGIGYVGLPTATVLANLGFQVTGIDVNQAIVDEVCKGESPTNEPGLDKLILENRQKGNLKATGNAVEALKETDITIVCVQTPLGKEGKLNLTYLEKACKTIAKTNARGRLVIIQSTVPPGTTRNILMPILEGKSGSKCGVDFWLAYCPERMAPGNGLKDLVTNTRVVGGYDLKSAELAAELFKLLIKGEVKLTSLENAEMAKLAENTFRYVNIAFANELALICSEIGVDVTEVIELANTHPRVSIHKPGCGVGGPCLSKDTNLLLNVVRTKNFRPEVVLASRKLNNFMPEYTAELAVTALRNVGKSVDNSKIAIFGSAYKGEVNDARNSPAEEIIGRLRSLGAEVVVFDPYCDESFGTKKVKEMGEAVDRADCIIIATDHKIFQNLELSRIKALMKEKPVIVDGKQVVDPKEAETKGFIYLAIGHNLRVQTNTTLARQLLKY